DTDEPAGPSAYRSLQSSSDQQGRFLLGGLKPSETYMIRISNKQHTLGAVLSVAGRPAKKEGEVQAIRGPQAGVRGRTVDKDNKPIAGALVSVSSRLTHGFGSISGSGSIVTDARGQFQLANVLAGDEISVGAGAEGYARNHSDKFTAESGKVHPVPDIALE